ncbi:MAG: hypothetical protein U0797_14845 [Gemmataceae bacterium]
MATDIWNGLTWTPVPSRDTPRPRASVEGCLFFNREGAVGLGLVYPRELPRFSLDVVNNTFVVNTPLSIRFGARPSEAAAVRAAGKAGTIHLSGNVFVGRLGLIDHFAMREWNVLPASEAVGLYPEAFDWRDSHNAYERGMPMVWARDQPDPTKPQRTIEGLADWHKFMGVRESTSVQGDVRFTGVSGMETDLDTLRPGQFRLAEGSVGKKAGPVGRDLGADVDAVGPGAAYEAWKQTPDYQRWLKDMAR